MTYLRLSVQAVVFAENEKAAMGIAAFGTFALCF
jgi:hypothetical protein